MFPSYRPDPYRALMGALHFDGLSIGSMVAAGPPAAHHSSSHQKWTPQNAPCAVRRSTTDFAASITPFAWPHNIHAFSRDRPLSNVSCDSIENTMAGDSRCAALRNRKRRSGDASLRRRQLEQLLLYTTEFASSITTHSSTTNNGAGEHLRRPIFPEDVHVKY